jgi:lysophospholipase L1-like esterase
LFDMPKATKRMRCAALWCLTLFVGLSLLAAYLFWWHLPVGTGAAGPAVSRDPFQAPWTERTVLLVGLGDSVTAGFGASEGHSYFQRLVVNPPDDTVEMRGICLKAVMPNLSGTNLAISGSTSLQCLQAELPKLPVQPGNVLGIVVITTGGNDIIHNYGRTPPTEGAMYGATMEQARPWFENYRRRLDTTVQEITSRFPGGCHIFLANIYDPTDGTGSARRVGLPSWPDSMAILRAYNKAIADCAAEYPNVHLVDIHSLFLGHGLFCRQFWRPSYRRSDPYFWYHDILEDPNERGYDALRRVFLNAMADVLNRPSTREQSSSLPSS